MKRILVLLLCGILLFSWVSCDKSDPDGSAESSEDGESDTPNESTSENGGTDSSTVSEDLTLVEGDQSLITMVYSSYASDAEAAAVQKLRNALYEQTGVYLNVQEDYLGKDDPDAFELLIGNTNRQETADLLQVVEEYEFAVRTTENKVVIAAWSDSLLAEAVDWFLEHLASGEYGEIGNGILKIKSDIDYCSDGSDNTAYFASLTASDTLVADYSEYLFTMNYPSPATWAQGGCYKDGYYYQACIRKDSATNEALNDVIIVKYEVATGKLISRSESLPLNHANDITYNSKLGYFVVCHNNPNRTYVSYLDPETLTIVKTVEIDYKIYSIDYNAEKDRYVIGLSGGQSFMILDGNFEALTTYFAPTSRSASCTTQGVSSDDRYIYFVLYHPNLITVYDWSGNFVTLIELDLGSIEPENIAVVRHEIYISCGTSGGAKLYRIGSFVPKE